MTNWFASRSRWKTISPVSGHLIHRFCGTSRLARRLRILGRTTLLIQLTLIPLSLSRSGLTALLASCILIPVGPYGPPRLLYPDPGRASRPSSPLVSCSRSGLTAPHPSCSLSLPPARGPPPSPPGRLPPPTGPTA